MAAVEDEVADALWEAFKEITGEATVVAVAVGMPTAGRSPGDKVEAGSEYMKQEEDDQVGSSAAFRWSRRAVFPTLLSPRIHTLPLLQIRQVLPAG